MFSSLQTTAARFGDLDYLGGHPPLGGFFTSATWYCPYGRAVLGGGNPCRFLSTGSPTRHGSAPPFGDGKRMN